MNMPNNKNQGQQGQGSQSAPNKNQQNAQNLGGKNQAGQTGKQQPSGPQRSVGDDLRKYPQGEPGDHPSSTKPHSQNR
jgi:hypothetical protein